MPSRIGAQNRSVRENRCAAESVRRTTPTGLFSLGTYFASRDLATSCAVGRLASRGPLPDLVRDIDQVLVLRPTQEGAFGKGRPRAICTGPSRRGALPSWHPLSGQNHLFFAAFFALKVMSLTRPFPRAL